MSISLSKGQQISLTKSGGGSLERIAVGLGWGKREVRSSGFLGFGASVKQLDVDLDASCILYDRDRSMVDVVWFRERVSKDGSVQHSGDDRGGGGGVDEPNEVINVDLTRVPPGVRSIVFVVNSFSGESFDGVPFAFCNVVDLSSRREAARYNLQTAGGSYKGFIIAKVSRDSGNGWQFTAVGEPVNGEQRTVQQIEPTARKFA